MGITDGRQARWQAGRRLAGQGHALLLRCREARWNGQQYRPLRRRCRAVLLFHQEPWRIVSHQVWRLHLPGGRLPFSISYFCLSVFTFIRTNPARTIANIQPWLNVGGVAAFLSFVVWWIGTICAGVVFARLWCRPHASSTALSNVRLQ